MALVLIPREVVKMNPPNEMMLLEGTHARWSRNPLRGLLQYAERAHGVGVDDRNYRRGVSDAFASLRGAERFRV